MKRFYWLFIISLAMGLPLEAEKMDLSGVDTSALAAAGAVEEPTEDEEAAEEAFEPFPLALVLEKVLSGKAEWGPQWPRELPPDAFTVLFGDVLAVSVRTPEEAWSFRLNDRGLAEELPLWVNGELLQGEVLYDEDGLIAFIRSPRWEAEILEYKDDEPSLARIKLGDAYYFAALRYSPAEISEVWYDAGGDALGLFYYHLVEEGRIASLAGHYLAENDSEEPVIHERNVTFYRNSWGLVSEVDEDEGRYEVSYYDDGLPRYWEKSGPLGWERYTLQWDDAGFLVRVHAETGTADEAEPAEELDYIYEYPLDENGAWLEAREITIKSIFDALVPAGQRLIHRRIEYRPSDDGTDEEG